MWKKVAPLKISISFSTSILAAFPLGESSTCRGSVLYSLIPHWCGTLCKAFFSGWFKYNRHKGRDMSLYLRLNLGFSSVGLKSRRNSCVGLVRYKLHWREVFCLQTALKSGEPCQWIVSAKRSEFWYQCYFWKWGGGLLNLHLIFECHCIWMGGVRVDFRQYCKSSISDVGRLSFWIYAIFLRASRHS